MAMRGPIGRWNCEWVDGLNGFIHFHFPHTSAAPRTEKQTRTRNPTKRKIQIQIAHCCFKLNASRRLNGKHRAPCRMPRHQKCSSSGPSKNKIAVLYLQRVLCWMCIYGPKSEQQQPSIETFANINYQILHALRNDGRKMTAPSPKPLSIHFWITAKRDRECQAV